MKSHITEEITLPEGVQASYDGRVLEVKGPNAQLAKHLYNPNITIRVNGNRIIIDSPKATQREKRMIYTFRSHINNLVKGSLKDYVYKLKICSGHFPMNVSLTNDKLTIKNFLGEAVPRVLKLKQGVKVKHNGDIIEVSAPDKELAGQQAADIEQLTRITNRDRRIFQDGVYIIEKSGGAAQ